MSCSFYGIAYDKKLKMLKNILLIYSHSDYWCYNWRQQCIFDREQYGEMHMKGKGVLYFVYYELKLTVR